MAELDAMPDPSSKQKKKNDKLLASVIGWQKKYGSKITGS